MLLSASGTALAAPVAERTYSQSVSESSGPVSERTYSDAGSGGSATLAERSYSTAPSVAEPGPAPALEAAAAAVPPATSPDSGLSALAIVLISIGGVVVLVAVALTARRVVHQAHPAA